MSNTGHRRYGGHWMALDHIGYSNRSIFLPLDFRSRSFRLRLFFLPILDLDMFLSHSSDKNSTFNLE